MQTEESDGPRIELWGIPYLRDCALTVDAFIVTVCFLSVRYDAIECLRRQPIHCQFSKEIMVCDIKRFSEVPPPPT